MNKIHTISARTNTGQPCPSVDCYRKYEDALLLFVKYELGFGGQIISVTPHQVVTRTQVLSCVDTTTFVGEYEQMILFNRIAEFHAALVSHRLDYISGQVYDQMVEAGISTKAFNLAHFAPLLIGGKLALIAMILALEYPLPDNVESDGIPTLEDLCAVAALIQEGTDRETAFSLLH